MTNGRKWKEQKGTSNQQKSTIVIKVCQISEGTGRGTATAQRPSKMSSFTVRNI